jgi:hypothetical protein
LLGLLLTLTGEDASQLLRTRPVGRMVGNAGNSMSKICFSYREGLRGKMKYIVDYFTAKPGER